MALGEAPESLRSQSEGEMWARAFIVAMGRNRRGRKAHLTLVSLDHCSRASGIEAMASYSAPHPVVI